MPANAINDKTKLVFEKIIKNNIASEFYLAGGTALAIHFGHRESIDLDFFSQKDFSNSLLKNELSKIGEYFLSGEDAGTLHGTLDGVKLSFLLYKYKLLYPLIDFAGMKLADERDIAAMKIDAISSRGSKKDFIDLYFLLEKYSLDELLMFFENKFKGIGYNKLHILKSLVFFEGADLEPAPIMLKKADWEEVKKRIISKSKNCLHNGF
jgi:hypothetical protein